MSRPRESAYPAACVAAKPRLWFRVPKVILATPSPGAQGPCRALPACFLLLAMSWGVAAATFLLLAMSWGAAAASGPATGMDAWRTLLRHHIPEAAQQARAALLEPQEPPAHPDAIAAYVLARTAGLTGTTPEVDSLLQALFHTPSGAGAALVGLAQLRLEGGEPDSAASLFGAARARLAATGDRAGEIYALGMLAWVYLSRGNVERAIPPLEEALAGARELPQRELEAWLNLRLGLALFSSRRYNEAAPYYEAAVAMTHELDIPEWEAEGHINLSVVARWRMDLDAAMAHRQAALEGYRASGNDAGQARALHYIAVIHMMRGELPQAMRLLRDAIVAAERAGESREAATSQGDLASLNSMLGNYELALQQYEEALRAYQPGVQAGKPDRQFDAWAAGMLGNIALVLMDLGRLREAGDYMNRALAAIQRTGSRRDEPEIRGNLGLCLCLSGERPRGREELRAAIDSARVWGAPLTEATALSDLGACLLMDGDVEAADSAYAAAEALAARTGYFRLQGDVLAGRARVMRQRGDPAAALALLERAMTLAEGVRARSRGAEQIQARAHARSEGTYADAVDLSHMLSLTRPAAAERAFEFIQRAKARSLLDLLTEAEIGLRCRADPRYVQREQAILDSIADLLAASASPQEPAAPPGTVATTPAAPGGGPEMAIARLEDELSALESELREADPRYAAVQYPRPETLEHLQTAVLAPGELLLEYLLGEDASYVCAVTRETYRLAKLPPRAQIEAEVDALLPLLQDYDLTGGAPGYLAAPLAALSESLLGPIREECRRAQRLIVAPHGAAHYVPFEALFLEDPSAGSTSPPRSGEGGFGSLPYLVRTTDVVYVHAAGALTHRRPAADRQPAGSPARLLVVGNPPAEGSGDGTRAFFGVGAPRAAGAAPALPGAEAELAMIRDVFRQAQIVVLEGRDATEDGLRQAAAGGPYTLVHVAAHGLFNERRPRYSGLILAPPDDGGADGFLTVGEVFGIELECDQIVLSACSSALGEHITGEGLYGLTRAFEYAGAGCVIAALWDVSDEATASFMRMFYEQLAREDSAGGAHALAEAKRRWLREAPDLRPPAAPLDMGHPCFWAAFVASGETR
jgi:CHAT domain-containing protein